MTPEVRIWIEEALELLEWAHGMIEAEANAVEDWGEQYAELLSRRPTP